jgi:hypothetical protein
MRQSGPPLKEGKAVGAEIARQSQRHSALQQFLSTVDLVELSAAKTEAKQ